ncbi:TNT antitoxin family protein (plasmid) [Mycobacterium avium subsp. hominissuis]|uniref:Imm61 family immunity protein n=1 Tax=Mycobacterium avium TaxID=1764 RepID=UPI0031406CF6
MASATLSPDLLAWAQAAGYNHTRHDDRTLELHPVTGANTRYTLDLDPAGRRLRLSRNDPEESDADTVLLIASPKVVEHHLYCLFGDDIREDLALPDLPLPWQPSDLARGYTLTTDAAGSHVLVHHSRGPVAAAPDATLGLLTLVPLSHLLGFSAADLRRAFLAEDGAPLMAAGYYASR